MCPFYMTSLANTVTAELSLPQTDTLPNDSLNGLVGWIGIAQLEELTTPNRPLSGSAGCRRLLQKMLTTLNITGRLNDHHFPYHIISLQPSTEKVTYFVSFSHSQTSVAVLLANQPVLGIDIEKHPISPAIAQRYFSLTELSWLKSLPNKRQPIARTLLWTLKESRIKSQTDSQLFSGIRYDILADIDGNGMLSLLNDTTDSPSRSRLYCYDDPHTSNATTSITNRLIGFNRVQQCGWWINFSQNHTP